MLLLKKWKICNFEIWNRFFNGTNFFEFKISGKKGSSTRISAIGYIENLIFIIPVGTAPIASDANMTVIPRRNGWKNMLKILAHLEISKYDCFKK